MWGQGLAMFLVNSLLKRKPMPQTISRINGSGFLKLPATESEPGLEFDSV